MAKAPATEVHVGERTVRVSNPDRVYFPATGATKFDLVEYYLAVGSGIVNALRERPCMLHRFPTGVSGEKVHQKRVPGGAPPWLETVRVDFPRYGLHADELCVTELAQVIWAVQMSTVEFHPWNSRRADVEKPDEWRIDLDPMPDCPLATVRRVAHVVHEVLDELGAVGWPKTSGGRGMHVYVRIAPSFGFTDVRRAALAFAREVERRAPRRRHDDVVAQGPRSRRAVRRLQPERSGPHDGRGLLGARLARRHGVDTDHLGRGRRRRAERLHDGDRSPRFAELGDLHAGIDDSVFAIDELLEWAARDERAGAVDAGPPDEADEQTDATARSVSAVGWSLVEPERVAERVDELDPGADLVGLEPGLQVGILLRRELRVQVPNSVRRDVDGAARRPVAMVFGQVEHELAAGDLHVQRESRFESMLEVDRHAEVLDVERFRFVDVEDAQDRNGGVEFHGCRVLS